MFGDDGAIVAEREGVGAAPGLGLEVRRKRMDVAPPCLPRSGPIAPGGD